jgi:hypothetical protein
MSLRTTLIAAAAAAIAIGDACLAPVGHADPYITDPTVQPPPAAQQPPPQEPNLNQGTGDPAHNICIITGHDC